MKTDYRILTIAMFLFVLVFASESIADKKGKVKYQYNKKYNNVYDRQRYNQADINGDGVLSREEWNAELRKKEQGGNRWDFNIADSNNDGVVDINEAKNAKWQMHKPTAEALYNTWKSNHLNLSEKECFALFVKQYPDKAKELLANHKWLEYHPKVVNAFVKNSNYLVKHSELREALYLNKNYLANHPNIATSVYADKKWLDGHPETASKIYGNRKWLTNHPNTAKKVYSNRQKAVNNVKMSKKLYNRAKKHSVY